MHDHSHHAAPDASGAFRVGIAVNVAYVAVEAGAGLATGSLALLADAGHNLIDVVGLLVAWGAAVLALRSGSARYSWGYGRATIFATLGNAVAILIGVGAVVWEAVGRFSTPAPVPGMVVMLVAAAGIAVNAGTAWLFARHGDGDLNVRGAYLHMATDAAVSGAVVLSAGLMLLTGWLWLDPAVAIAVSLLISVTAWQLLRDAMRLGMDGVPNSVDQAAVASWIAAQPGVAGVHDLHIWGLSTTRIALAVHVVWQGGNGDRFLDDLAEGLEHRFGIGHATVQLEAQACERWLACVSG